MLGTESAWILGTCINDLGRIQISIVDSAQIEGNLHKATSKADPTGNIVNMIRLPRLLYPKTFPTLRYFHTRFTGIDRFTSLWDMLGFY